MSPVYGNRHGPVYSRASHRRSPFWQFCGHGAQATRIRRRSATAPLPQGILLLYLKWYTYHGGHVIMIMVMTSRLGSDRPRSDMCRRRCTMPVHVHGARAGQIYKLIRPRRRRRLKPWQLVRIHAYAGRARGRRGPAAVPVSPRPRRRAGARRINCTCTCRRVDVRARGRVAIDVASIDIDVDDRDIIWRLDHIYLPKVRVL